MSYKITVRIYQPDTSTFFSVVEKTVWDHGDTWYQEKDQHVLTNSGSGTSGTIRLKSDQGEEIIFALGGHNYKPWCDAVPDATGYTGAKVHPEYYGGKRDYQREKQLAHYSSQGPSGRNFQVQYVVTDGHDLLANLIIGGYELEYTSGLPHQLRANVK